MTFSHEALLQQALGDLENGNYAAAEMRLRQVLSADEDNAVAYLWLSRTLSKLNRPTESEEAVERSISIAPSAEALNFLISLLLSQRRLQSADKRFEELIALTPHDPHAYINWAKLATSTGDLTRGLRIIEQGRSANPDSIDLVLAGADFSTVELEAQLQSALSRFQDNPAARSRILRKLALHKAHAARAIPSDRSRAATSWDDLSTWADLPSLAAFEQSLIDEISRPKARLDALVDLASVKACVSDWDGAEKLYATARKRTTGAASSIVTFSQALFAEIANLSDAEITAQLPPVVNVKTSAPTCGLNFYLASDPLYFERFTLPLLSQIVERVPLAHAHIHLLDGRPTQWAALSAQAMAIGKSRISVTAEASGVQESQSRAAPLYYHAIRYIRFYQHLNAYQQPTWIMDVDADINHDPTLLLQGLKNADIGMYANTAALEPWYKIPAGLIGISPTERGLRFSRLVAAFIAYWLRLERIPWGTDQAALYCCFVSLARLRQTPRVHFLNNTVMAFGPDTSAAISFTSGWRKFNRSEE